MKKISVVTLGCKVNQYDTAVILNQLPSSKYVKNDKFDDKADVYVIDTCTVTRKADSEARNYIYRAKRSNPDGVVIVTGCYAQVSSEELSTPQLPLHWFNDEGYSSHCGVIDYFSNDE